MEHLKLNTLFSESQIKERIGEIGASITDQCKGKDIVAICTLRGSFMFYSDLIRQIDADITCDFFSVSSYNNSHQSSGEVRLNLDLSTSVRGTHVLLVEDIVDTGLTMNYLLANLKSRDPAAITTVSLLSKPEAHKVKVDVDHVGFEISNDFVVGYGLDYQGLFRNLPYIAQVQNIN